jgi:hypothetical protein
MNSRVRLVKHGRNDGLRNFRKEVDEKWIFN